MIYLDLLILIIGVLMYALAQGKVAEIGKFMFVCGLLAFLLTGHVPVLR
jgi:hypothetical protein